MQFEFQGHPQEVEKESLDERVFGKGQRKCGKTQGVRVCVTMTLQLSSSIFRGRGDQVTRNSREGRCGV